MFFLVLCFAFLTGLCDGRDNLLPSFSWVDENVPISGVPLLRIKFPDGGQDDFAFVKSYNPIPVGPTERASDLDPCIFHGYLMNENEVHVTLTGCPFADTFRIQFSSKRLRHNMFRVTDGIVEVVKFENRLPDKTLRIETSHDTPPPSSSFRASKPLSKYGYISNFKAYYDDNFYNKFGDDSINEIRRALAHTQHIMKWPSLTTKLYFNLDPNVTHLAEKWNTNKDLLATCTKYNSNFTLTGIHTNIYFTSKDPNNPSGASGMSYVSGGCQPDYRSHCAMVEFIKDDINFATVVAHELGHNHGMYHDFLGRGTDYVTKPENIRRDSKGNPCSGIGSIMDYAASNEGDQGKWSTCSVEDMAYNFNYNPKCMKEIDPKNPPTELQRLPLTPYECDLTNLNLKDGFQQLNLSGIACKTLCIDGICTPSYTCNNGSQPACISICGDTTCKNAVTPPPCDLTAQLQDFTGTKQTKLNGFIATVTCQKGMCYSNLNSYNNSVCYPICGKDTCTDAVDPGQCDLGITVWAYKYVCYNRKTILVLCNNGMCMPTESATKIGSYQNSCIKICGATNCLDKKCYS